MIIVKDKVLTKNVPTYSQVRVMETELECDEIMVVSKSYIFHNHIMTYFSSDLGPVQAPNFFVQFLKNYNLWIVWQSEKCVEHLEVRDYTSLFCYFRPINHFFVPFSWWKNPSIFPSIWLVYLFPLLAQVKLRLVYNC